MTTVSVNSPSPSPQTPVSSIPSPTSPPNNLSNINNNSASGNSNNDNNGNGNPPVKRKASRRANTAERRATHNAVERQRRETLNSRFLDLAALLPNLATVRRPSKSAIVNSSIALIHSHRRARALAGRELRALDEETHALRREINEWRARARATAGSGLPHLPPLQPPQRSSEFLALISESTNIDEKIVEEEERRAYLLAEGAPADGDYDPEDSDDVNGDWTSTPSHNLHNDGPMTAPMATSPSVQQPQWQVATLQMQYAQAMQQAQAQALQQQAQMQSIGSIGNINMGTGLMTMGMPSANGGNPLSVGPLGIMGVGLSQGQAPNATAPAPTWSAHPHSHSHPSFSHSHSHSNPHSPADSQGNPFAFTMSGNGLPDVSLHNQQQYPGVIPQNFMNNNSHHGNGYNGHNQRTPPSTTASVSSGHDDDAAGGSSPLSVGNMSSNGGDNSSVSMASTPSPIVPGRQANGNVNSNANRNGSGNRKRNVNLNLNMNSGSIGSMKTGWGLVGPHSIPGGMTTGNVPTNMLGMGIGMGMNMGLGLGSPGNIGGGSDAGVGGMGIVPVAGMIL